MDKRFYTWDEFLSDMHDRIIPALMPRAGEFNGVWGPPRGGIIMAVMLSHQLGIPYLLAPQDKKTLIVDDIADTGETLKDFSEYSIATLFYHRQSIVEPSLWLHEKKDQWVVFPWEKQ